MAQFNIYLESPRSFNIDLEDYEIPEDSSAEVILEMLRSCFKDIQECIYENSLLTGSSIIITYDGESAEWKNDY